MDIENPFAEFFDDPNDFEDPEVCPHCDYEESECDCYEDEVLEHLLSDFEDLPLEEDTEEFNHLDQSLTGDDDFGPYHEPF